MEQQKTGEQVLAKSLFASSLQNPLVKASHITKSRFKEWRNKCHLLMGGVGISKYDGHSFLEKLFSHWDAKSQYI